MRLKAISMQIWPIWNLAISNIRLITEPLRGIPINIRWGFKYDLV